jgi:hypothetical protein
MRRSVVFACLLLVTSLVAASCEEPTPPTTPSLSDPVRTTFTGTIGPNGAISETFVVSRAGSLTATLTGLTPNGDATVGFGLGTFGGTSCTMIILNDKAFPGIFLIGAAGSAGILCVRVYDTGGITEPTTFTVEIVHP